MSSASPPAPARGFVFGATGPLHLQMALGAARSVTRVHPDIPVDLFGDITPGDLPADHPFDAIHPLRAADTRPKFEALLHSRFDRTLYLDNDTRLVAPVDDVFDLLGRVDVVAAHDPLRNSFHALADTDAGTDSGPIPAAFPQLQGGVIGRAAGPRATAFLSAWHDAFRADPRGIDQPSLRAVAWQMPDVRLAILPPDYNFLDSWSLLGMRPSHAAPRLVHSRHLKDAEVLRVAAAHTCPAAPLDDPVLPLILGRLRLAILTALLTHDRTGAPAQNRKPAPSRFNRAELRAIGWAALREFPHLLRRAIQRKRLK
ncbi:MAG: hypothetical protein AAGH70_00290 [Pseudomonadota bacterium]